MFEKTCNKKKHLGRIKKNIIQQTKQYISRLQNRKKQVIKCQSEWKTESKHIAPCVWRAEIGLAASDWLLSPPLGRAAAVWIPPTRGSADGFKQTSRHNCLFLTLSGRKKKKTSSSRVSNEARVASRLKVPPSGTVGLNLMLLDSSALG